MRSITLIIFFSFILLNSTSKSNDSVISVDEEHKIISVLLKDTYDISLCHQVLNEEYYFRIRDSNPNLLNKIKSKRLLTKIERDTIKKFITFASDSLLKLDAKFSKKYLLKHFDRKSNEFKMIKKYNNILNPKKLKVELIKQKGLIFFTKSDVRKRGMDYVKFGKNDSILNAGMVHFSRVYYSEKYNSGFFSFTYLGASDCGNSSYVFFRKDNGMWIHSKTMYTGAF